MPRIVVALSLAALAFALGWFHVFSSDYNLFSDPAFSRGLATASIVTTAFLAVFVAGQLADRVVLHAIYGVASTGFQRAILYAGLSAVACVAVLAHLGVNVAALLTTSAILTAMIGLALQPSLGGLIAGLTLHTDRVLRIGDTILQGGEPAEVIAFNWRSVSTRKRDGSIVVLPNARIVDRPVAILPRDRSFHVETVFPAPIVLPPHRLEALLNDLVTDLPAVDPGRPVTVAPVGFDVEKAATRYRVRYWIYPSADRSELEGEILRRIWYALQREGIAWPVSDLYAAGLRHPAEPSILLGQDWGLAVEDALRRSGSRADDPAAHPHAPAIIRMASPLFFVASERIVLPPQGEDSMCLLVRGEAREIESEFDTPRAVAGRPEGWPPANGDGRLSRRLMVRQIVERLAPFIGPYAEVAVLRAALELDQPRAISERVAEEIADPAERRRFLDQMRAADPRIHGPGAMFPLRIDLTGSLVPVPLLRARLDCAWAVLPTALLIQD